MRFFLGLHQPSDAKNVWSNGYAAFISVNRLRNRISDFTSGDWIMDSGAFSTISQYGGYPYPVSEYAEQIIRWAKCGQLLAAVAQDYMCEPHMIQITGLSITEHQRLTIERYDALISAQTGVYIMPALQGYEPDDYVNHLKMYRAFGHILPRNSWIGVGSVCKRNGNPQAIEAVLLAIHNERPDLRLHGFGLKSTALGSGLVRELLYTADSMAWSFTARKNGRNANDWREALAYARKIDEASYQFPLFISRSNYGCR